ncbi:MAG TPA: hypothetical protein O0X39_00920 [Methanocorpusculum sp.]|nr:hypothetical protein [Methanocorpusculum sp.]
MIREVQRIDSITFNEEKYTATFSGMEIPIPLLIVTKGEDAGRTRITVKYNGETYVMRSHASDEAAIKADTKRIEETWKSYNAAVKQHEKTSKKSARLARVEAAKAQMQSARDNQLKIDKKAGTVHFAGKTVSALDVRMEIQEYGGRKRLLIDYDNESYGYEAPQSAGGLTKKISGARLDKMYSDWCKAREKALDK